MVIEDKLNDGLVDDLGHDDDGDKDDDDYPCSSNIPHLLLNHDNGDGDGCDGCVNETMKVIGTNELTNN